MADSRKPSIDINITEMGALWEEVARVTGNYRRDVAGLPVLPPFKPDGLRAGIADFQCEVPRPWQEVIGWADKQMRVNQLHTSHPRYFGLFNPAPAPMGIVGEALSAAYNAQLATWSHSPFAVELELHLIREFASRLGMDRESADGTFCTGGAEANHTALLCALSRRFPAFSKEGLRAVPGRPTLYVSNYAHHSWVKAARACGLGTDAVRTVAADAKHLFDANSLLGIMVEDMRNGAVPFMVCATAGTTNAGIIEPLDAAGTVAEAKGVWYHVDAAWGGAACLVPEYRSWLQGIGQADSISFDAHKFLSVPMGAGMFFTKHASILQETFGVATDYMPADAGTLTVTEPYAHSLQWSRRFIGLKVFLPLAVAGWDGLVAAIRKQTILGAQLRQLLVADGWQVVNDSPLPVVCFVDPSARDPNHVERIKAAVLSSGEAWISTTMLGVPVLRACITNFRTEYDDLVGLVLCLRAAREEEKVRAGSSDR